MGNNKIKYLLLLCLVITIVHLTEGKRTLSGRRTSSNNRGSSSSGRRTSSSSQTHYSPAPSSSQSKPSSVYHAPNSDHVKLTHAGSLNSQPAASQNKPPSYGWSVNQPAKPAGPPPAYSASNIPGGAKTNIHEPPPAYKPNNAAPPSYSANNPASSGVNYPKQTYNTASGTGAGHHGGVHSPVYAHTVRPIQSGTGYHPAPSGIQPGFYPHQTAGHYSGGAAPLPPGGFPAGVQPVHYGGGAHPVQAAPVFVSSGIQPGFYSPNSFPGRSSSGPGFGTGLVAGALGGAILGHALTPSHTHHVVSGQPVGSSGDNQDRVIIINNNPGQPATVTNAAGQPANGVTVVNNGVQPDQSGPPLAQYPNQQQPAPVAGAPLAPFPNQQQQQQPPLNQPAPGTQPDGTVPLAPFPINTNGNNTEQPAIVNGTQMMTYCTPVYINVTDPNNPNNVTTQEQVYCYQVPYNPAEQQQASSLSGTQPPDLMSYNAPAATQRTSTASLAPNSNINSGSKGLFLLPPTFDPIVMTMIAFLITYSSH